MARGLGWVQDAPGSHPAFSGAYAAAQAKFGRPDLQRFRKGRLEQHSASSCVAFAKARCMHMAFGIQGHEDAPVPSPLFIYGIGRAQERAGLPPPHPPLTDTGSQPALVATAIRKLGFVPWSALPYEDSKVNQAIPPDVYRSAFPQGGLTTEQIFGLGSRVSQVEAALKAGHPVEIGMSVDKRFLNHTGSEPITGIDPTEIVGGHMLTVLALLDTGVLIDNWWGTEWGFDDGFGLLSYDLFSSPWVQDVIAVDAAPLYAEG